MIIRNVTQLQDAVLPAVIDLYQTAFPVEEQMLASFFWTLFHPDSKRHLAVAEQDDAFIGFVVWEDGDASLPGYLWYLAVREDNRGGGAGKSLYGHAVHTLHDAGVPAVMFEVELPEEAEQRAGILAGQIAHKRISWYCKLGARSLKGVHFDCTTDWMGSIVMLPMIHSFNQSITAQQAFDWGVAVLADGNASDFRLSGSLYLL